MVGIGTPHYYILPARGTEVRRHGTNIQMGPVEMQGDEVATSGSRGQNEYTFTALTKHQFGILTPGALRGVSALQ